MSTPFFAVPSEVPDLLLYNRQAWNNAVAQGDRWTLPVTPEQIAEARAGAPRLVLTPQLPIPADWLGDLTGRDVLCLASGGGQQGPLLAAAGANVTVFDNSDAQLAQDQAVALREGLDLRTVQGDMRNLGAFANTSFDLIVHPVSNCFVDTVLPVWQEAARVLRPGGELLSGFCNPVLYAYDPELAEQGILQLRYPLPFSALESLTPAERQEQYLDSGQPLQFGHTLSDQIGGQLAAGLVLVGFYEDHMAGTPEDAYFPHFMATRSRKLV